MNRFISAAAAFLIFLSVSAAGTYEEQVRNREGEVQKLARDYDKSGKEVAGIVTVQFTVGPDGAVKDARVIASMVMNPAFERDLLNLIRTWTFENPEKYELIITYPFAFHKVDYKRKGEISFVGHTGAGDGAPELGAETVARAEGNLSLAERAYSRLLDRAPGSGGFMVVSLYFDEEANLSRTSCSYSDIEDSIFNDKIRNWLGCNAPVGDYPGARVVKIAVKLEPDVGPVPATLTEERFQKIAGAYAELAGEVYRAKAAGSPGASLGVKITVGASGEVTYVETTESTLADPTVEGAVSAAIYGWLFPAGNETVTYEYRMDL